MGAGIAHLGGRGQREQSAKNGTLQQHSRSMCRVRTVAATDVIASCAVTAGHGRWSSLHLVRGHCFPFLFAPTRPHPFIPLSFPGLPALRGEIAVWAQLQAHCFLDSSLESLPPCLSLFAHEFEHVSSVHEEWYPAVRFYAV